MMKYFLLVLTILLSTVSFGQKLEKVIVGEIDPHNFYINDGESTQIFYYKMVPKDKPVGVLTIFPSGGETIENLLQQITLHQIAYDNNLLVIIPAIGVLFKGYLRWNFLMASSNIS